MLEIGVDQLIILECLVLLVSIAVGIVSFGFAILMTPFFLIFLEPRMVIEINLTLGFFQFIAIFAQSWRNLNGRTLASLVLGGLMGVPLGLFLALNVADGPLGLILACAVTVTALFGLMGKLRYFSRERLVAVPVGVSYAFLNASLGLGGPIVSLFALSQRWERDRTRATLSGFFMMMGVVVLGSHAGVGLLGLEEIKSALLFIPALMLGSVISALLIGRINQKLFRRLVLTVLLCAGLMAMVREFIGIL